MSSGARFMSFRVATGLKCGSKWCFHVCQPVTSTGESGSAWQRGDHSIRVGHCVCVSQLRRTLLQADHDGITVDTETVSNPAALTI